MPKIEYVPRRFSAATLVIIETANKIIEEYLADGMRLTLRQIYYQFVSRDLLANKQTEYKRLGSIISDGRLAGLIDWGAIEDRTRNIKEGYHNTDPGDAVRSALDCFGLDMWENQKFVPEVWIEKEALIGVIEPTCRDLDVPFFACKGNVSQSEMWVAAMRMERRRRAGQKPLIIHLGDHDPSGIDMTRDIDDRLRLFMGGCPVERIALNYDQVEEYSPPPNPVKMTDSRATGYVERFGYSSWELDALEPRVIRELITSTVEEYTDPEALEERRSLEEKYRGVLRNVVKNWRQL